MRSPARNIVWGAGVALVGAILMLVPEIAHISTWKIVLGLIGLTVFFAAGQGRSAA